MFRKLTSSTSLLVAAPASRLVSNGCRYNSTAATPTGGKPEEATQAATTTTTTDTADTNTNTTPAANKKDEEVIDPIKNTPYGYDPNAGPLKVTDEGEFEPLRWIQRPYVDPALQPLTDENGQYIVSKQQWPTGELAYRPAPRSEVTPRFGYNIVSVKKPQTYWAYWRRNPHFSVSYAGIQVFFILGLAWIMGILMEEIRSIEQEGRVAGNHAGEVRGKGRTDRKKEKIIFSREEQDAMLSNAQESYLDGAETKYLGNRDYKMKKISRPQEYTYDEFRKR